MGDRQPPSRADSTHGPGRIALFRSVMTDGGVEKMSVHLARGLAACGVPVDLVAGECRGPYLERLEPPAQLIELGSVGDRHGHRPLADYLEHYTPDVVLAAKPEDCALALAARTICRGQPRVVAWPSTNYSGLLKGRPLNPIRVAVTRRKLARIYRRVDGIIAVSEGVAADVARLARLPRAAVHALPNPVVAPETPELAAETPGHPWLDSENTPVVIAVGALRRAKAFDVLIRAFARLRCQREARLVILGEGRQRQRLERLARRFGVSRDLALPGFVANPYAWMRRSRLLALSSRWEGSPTVIPEALSLGTPVVATDCPSGPRELLRDGEIGPLVPVGDPAALADAIAATLDNPPASAQLRRATEPYEMLPSAKRYLATLEDSGRDRRDAP